MKTKFFGRREAELLEGKYESGRRNAGEVWFCSWSIMSSKDKLGRLDISDGT